MSRVIIYLSDLKIKYYIFDKSTFAWGVIQKLTWNSDFKDFVFLNKTKTRENCYVQRSPQTVLYGKASTAVGRPLQQYYACCDRFNAWQQNKRCDDRYGNVSTETATSTLSKIMHGYVSTAVGRPLQQS